MAPPTWKNDANASAGTLRRKIRSRCPPGCLADRSRPTAGVPQWLSDATAHFAPAALGPPLDLAPPSLLGLPLALRAFAAGAEAEGQAATTRSCPASVVESGSCRPESRGRRPSASWGSSAVVFEGASAIRHYEAIVERTVAAAAARPLAPLPGGNTAPEPLVLLEQRAREGHFAMGLLVEMGSVAFPVWAERPPTAGDGTHAGPPRPVDLAAVQECRGRLPSPLPERLLVPLEIPCDSVDLVGGNGSWRRRKAEVELERRHREEEEQRRAEKERHAEKEQRREMLRQHRRKEEIERYQRWNENRETKAMVTADAEARQWLQEEKERLRILKEERLRLASLPQPCKACQSSGVCAACDGDGRVQATLLSPTVDSGSRSSRSFGRSLWGCSACAGALTHVAGDLRLGSGRCDPCNGTGEIVPSRSVRGTVFRSRAAAAQTSLFLSKSVERKSVKGDTGAIAGMAQMRPKT